MYVMQKLKQNVLAKTRRVVSVNQLLVENVLQVQKMMVLETAEMYAIQKLKRRVLVKTKKVVLLNQLLAGNVLLE